MLHISLTYHTYITRTSVILSHHYVISLLEIKHFHDRDLCQFFCKTALNNMKYNNLAEKSGFSMENLRNYE